MIASKQADILASNIDAVIKQINDEKQLTQVFTLASDKGYVNLG